MKKKKKAKPKVWQNHHLRIQARKEKYPAKSIYKLKEINEKFNIFKKGDKVADLGACPGSWLIYTSKQIGQAGIVIGVDLQKIKSTISYANIKTIESDIFELDPQDLINLVSSSFDVLISDMAPSTIGIKSVDAFNSFELCMRALEIAKMILKKDANFVAKIFQGQESIRFIEAVKENFKHHKVFKPQSCEKKSKEIYVIGLGKK